jgi:hypothetical protein
MLGVTVGDLCLNAVVDITSLNLPNQTTSDRLAAINSLLQAKGLRPLPSIGDNTKGFSEIIDIVEWLSAHTAQWQDVVFLVRRVNGAVYRHQIRFNSNGAVCDGVVFIPVVNGSVALVRQFRVPVGMETWELPRGFAELASDAAEAGAGAGGIPSALLRELDEEVIESVVVRGVQPLGAIADNTGTHNVWLDCYIVEIECDSSLLASRLGGTSKLGVRLVSWEELWRPSALEIRDAHSLAAIALARESVRAAAPR